LLKYICKIYYSYKFFIEKKNMVKSIKNNSVKKCLVQINQIGQNIFFVEKFLIKKKKTKSGIYRRFFYLFLFQFVYISNLKSKTTLEFLILISEIQNNKSINHKVKVI